MLTAEDLRSHLDYDPETGVFTRKKSWAGWRAGERVGGVAHGYLMTAVKGRRYYVHRLAWLHVYGRWPVGVIDHINGDPLDNRIANLRDVPQGQNAQNRRRPDFDSKTGLLGVTYRADRKRKYVAQIVHNKKTYVIGGYETSQEAHQAYLDAKRTLHAGFVE